MTIDGRTVALGVAIGVVAGAVAGIFGIGGGVIIVPALVLLLGLAQLEAAAVSLVAIAVGTVSALVPFVIEGRVVVSAGLVLGAGAITGAWLGGRVAHRVPARVLAWAFVVVVGAAAVRMLLPDSGGTAETMVLDPLLTVVLVIVGLVAGTLSVLLGIGGGLVYVPALVILADLAQHTAHGTSLAAILPAALVGARGHAKAGRMQWRLAGVVAGGSFVGGFLGAWVVQGIDADALRVAFGILLVVLAVRMAVATGRRVRPEAPPA